MEVGYYGCFSVYLRCIGFIFVVLYQTNKALGSSTIEPSTESHGTMTSQNTIPFSTEGMTSNLSESGVTATYDNSTLGSSTESQLISTTNWMTSNLSETASVMVTHETMIITSNDSRSFTHIASTITTEQDSTDDVKKPDYIRTIAIASSAPVVIVIIATVLICRRRLRKDPVDEIELQTGESYSERKGSMLSYSRRNSYSFYSEQNIERMRTERHLSLHSEDGYSTIAVTLTSFSPSVPSSFT